MNGADLTSTGLLTIDEPAALPTNAFGVQVIDRAGGFAWAEVRVPIFRPDNRLMRITQIATIVASWVMLIAVLRGLVVGGVGFRRPDVVAILVSMGFFLVAIGIAWSPLAIYGFVALMFVLGVQAFRAASGWR